jgi:hypothetical protein
MDLSLLSERWLRHAGQLARNKGRFDKACAIGSIAFSITGALGLILLSIFDTKHHQHEHYGFLIMFMYVACYLPESQKKEEKKNTTDCFQRELRDLRHPGMSGILANRPILPSPSPNLARQLCHQSTLYRW